MGSICPKCPNQFISIGTECNRCGHSSSMCELRAQQSKYLCRNHQALYDKRKESLANICEIKECLKCMKLFETEGLECTECHSRLICCNRTKIGVLGEKSCVYHKDIKCQHRTPCDGIRDTGQSQDGTEEVLYRVCKRHYCGCCDQPARTCICSFSGVSDASELIGKIKSLASQYPYLCTVTTNECQACDSLYGCKMCIKTVDLRKAYLISVIGDFASYVGGQKKITRDILERSLEIWERMVPYLKARTIISHNVAHILSNYIKEDIDECETSPLGMIRTYKHQRKLKDTEVSFTELDTGLRDLTTPVIMPSVNLSITYEEEEYNGWDEKWGMTTDEYDISFKLEGDKYFVMYKNKDTADSEDDPYESEDDPYEPDTTVIMKQRSLESTDVDTLLF